MAEVAETLNSMQIDAIGEILNISMGSSATSISKMLDKQVTITTPIVNVTEMKNVDYSNLDPAIAVKITYIEGIKGNNVMVFKQRDMNLILNQLMGINEEPDENFTFDELSISAACEVMNQMMGSASTALSNFLNRTINISTPEAVELDGSDNFMKMVGVDDGAESIVSVTFTLSIKDIMTTEFVSILPINLAKDIVSEFISPKTNNLRENVNSGYSKSDDVNPYFADNNRQSSFSKAQNVNVQMAEFEQLSNEKPEDLVSYNDNNMQLIMNVPLTVSVEIGKTSKKVSEILDFCKGTVIELDKQAGAPVDIIVNSKLVAKGDVVVIDDNFGVRITEILDSKNLLSRG